MIELGKKQDLVIVNSKEQGVYLGETQDAGIGERILLPKKQVPTGAKVGDVISVFVYRDSQDRLVATIHEPYLLLGQIARLRVRQTTKIGAFLDWGLENDLLLPFRVQTRKVTEGEEVLAALYVDKSGRLAATMRVYPYLEKNSPYHTGDTVKGTVYEIADNFGVFVAVDDRYSGMIPKREAQAGYSVGQELTLRVTHVKEDGKLDLSAREKAALQIHRDADAVLRKIREEYEGELPFDDKADPETIREVFGLSKAAFKRAVGHLYKMHDLRMENGKILVTDEGVRKE